MIDTIPFIIGFLIYITYTIITINIYSQGKKIDSNLIIFMLFLFYTALAGYVISFVDAQSSIFEKSFQIFIYFLFGSITIYFQYKDRFFVKDNNLIQEDRVQFFSILE